jgi:hypothetical protein
MAAKIFSTIRRVIVQGGGGDSVFNFRKDVEAGFSVGSVLTSKVDQAAGIAVSQSPAKLTTTVSPGVAVSTFATGAVKAPQGAGIGVGSVLTQISKPPSNPGIAITRVSYEYVGTKWVGTASDIGSDAWSNLSSAEGAADGSSATRAGQTLSTTSSLMRCQFQTISGKDDLTLDKIELKFYVAQAGTLLNNGGLSLDYRVGSVAAWTNLITYTDNQNFLSSPVVFDMTALVGTWANSKIVEVRIGAALPIAGQGITCSVNAADLHLEASLVDTL